MKKFVYLLILILISLLATQNLDANSDYRTFEYLEMTHGKLLENYTESEYKNYYEKVDRRRFMGWNIYKVYENVKVTYTTQTLFSYYNDGFSAIDYEYKLDRKQTSKLGLSATGTISTKTQKADKLFKNNLDASLKLSAEYLHTSEEKEAITIKLKVDPGTQVDLYIYGEGRITNGVACRYLFFVRMDRGGFEIFLVTTQYQRLEKKRI